MILLVSLAWAAQATAQEDPRLEQAVKHFQKAEYAEAGELLDEVAAESPSNLLNLNAMAAWYKADRCEEAMAARSRVDRAQPLEPQDIEDLDRVNAYCKLKSARAFRDAKEWDKGLGLLAGLETLDSKLAGEIVALRQEIEGAKAAELEQAKLSAEQEGQPDPIEKPAEPPPTRPMWALYGGLGLMGGGAVLGLAAAVKRGSDQRASDESWNAFVEPWSCSNAEQCDENIPEGHADREELRRLNNGIRIANVSTITMATVGIASFATGGALLGYYLLAESPSKQSIAPMLGPDAHGIVYSLQF